MPADCRSYPMLPAKPEKVIFNDFESVLCNLEEVDWSE